MYMYSVHVPTLIFTMYTCTHFVLFTQCPWWAIRGRRIPWHCGDAYRSRHWSGIHWFGWEWNWTATTGYKVRRNMDNTCLHEGVGCGCMHRYIVHDRVQSEYCDAITPSWFVVKCMTALTHSRFASTWRNLPPESMTFSVSYTGLLSLELETKSMTWKLLPNLHTQHWFFRGLDIVRPATIAQSSKRPSSGSSSQVYQPLAPQLDTQTCTDYYVLMNPRDRAKSQVCWLLYFFINFA